MRTKLSDRLRSDAGLSLVEVLVSTVIAVIAMVGLAHSFGIGRGQIERLALARVALAAAEERIAFLSTLPATHPDLQITDPLAPNTSPFAVNGVTYGVTRTIISRDSLVWNSSPQTYRTSLLRVTVEVEADAALPPTVQLTRLFAK